MNIAIVGTGISGLTAAYRLSSQHNVTLFEANSYIGGHTNTVDIELDGERHAIDTGFIVFNDWTYPNFIQLLNELNIASHPTTMSFSVRDEASRWEYNGGSLNGLFAQRLNLVRPRFLRMLMDIGRFNRHAADELGDGENVETVGAFCSRHGYGRDFIERYLLPMGAAIWSCPPGTFEQFPIQFIAEFYRNHGLLSIRHRPQWRVITGGSRTYVKAMCRSFRDRIHLNTPIKAVKRRSDRVDLWTEEGQQASFDHVVFACHSDQALRILGDDAKENEQAILKSFPYSRNIAVLHTDESLLPKSRRAWASWNYRIHDADFESQRHSAATVTYNMNILQGLRSRNTFCVTLNDESRIASNKVLKTFEYHHPVFTTQRAAAQARHHELLNSNRTSFCGAYWRNGFHEDGVVSANAVVAALQGSATEARKAANQSPTLVEVS